MNAAENIARFLGDRAPLGGPFGLLGLAPEAVDDDAVLAALERQLGRVAAHPEGDTPSADDVRLALHAAAAQLLDKHVRGRLTLRWRTSGGVYRPLDAAGAGQRQGAPRSEAEAALEHDALITLATFGGWNDASLRRLAALAHARGVPANSVADVLRHLSARPIERGAAPGSEAPASAPTAMFGSRAAPESSSLPSEPPSQFKRDLAIFLITVAVLFIAGVSLLVVVADRLVSPSGSSAGTISTQRDAPAATDATRPPAGGGAALVRPEPSAPGGSASGELALVVRPPQPGSAREVIREIEAAVREARSDPRAAVSSFIGPYAILCGWWPGFALDERRAAQNAVIELVFAIQRDPGAAEAAVSVLADPLRRLESSEPARVEHLLPAVWSSGILFRIARERQLPPALLASIAESLTRALGDGVPRRGGEFEEGAAAALEAGRPLVLSAGVRGQAEGPALAVADWVAAAESIASGDPARAEAMLVSLLGWLIIDGPDPTVDPAAFNAITAVTAKIGWREGGRARAVLLDWFGDARATSADLQAVTTALATKSSAPGVGSTMRLRPGADMTERSRLRAEYARVWGMVSGPSQRESVAQWVRAVDELRGLRHPSMPPLDALSVAVQAANLGAAADAIWAGREADTAAWMVRFTTDVTVPSAAGGGRTVVGPVPRDGEWARLFLDAGRNIPVRLSLLEHGPGATGALGPIDAETLVEAACFGSPIEVRYHAQQRVLVLTYEPTIVNAVLEILPRAPKIDSVSRMFAAVADTPLPRPTDEAWEVEARQALVQRLLEMLAASGPQSRIESLAARLASAYKSRAGISGDLSVRPEDAGGTLGNAGRTIVGALRSEAEALSPNLAAPVSLPEIDRALRGRRTVAHGPIQLFAADQATIAELLAFIVTAERPSRAARAAAILAELAQQRREVRHIFEQIRDVEFAIVELWSLRLEENAG